nr:protein SPIRAL1-like 5 [Ipomoea trifida]
MDRSPKMNRGGSYGGGQSSLGYLFGGAPPDNDKHNKRNETPPPSPIYAPPYGIDSDVNTTVTKPPPPPNSPGNTFERTLSQNSGNFAIASRPSTKVKSAPGGDSSLGYLFGDKI